MPKPLITRTPGLAEHVDGVVELSVRVALQLGVEGAALERVRLAAALHDVGKVAIPAAILHKPGPLDDDEWEQMAEHAVIGERLVAGVRALAPVARLVRASHERWDGTGYPDGLAGCDIPLGARIVAVCDAFDAMTSERPYRAALSERAAMRELRRCAGSQFDPVVVEALFAP